MPTTALGHLDVADALRWTLPIALGVLSLVLLAWALVGDRRKDRRRCPRCWQDMTGVEGLTCPECGRTARRERSLGRRRRRWGLATLALAGLVACGAAHAWNEASSRGAVWPDLVPSFVLVRWPEPWPTPIADELAQRADLGGLGPGSIDALVERLIPWVDGSAVARQPTVKRAERIELLALLVRRGEERWEPMMNTGGFARAEVGPDHRRAIGDAIFRAPIDTAADRAAIFPVAYHLWPDVNAWLTPAVLTMRDPRRSGRLAATINPFGRTAHAHGVAIALLALNADEVTDAADFLATLDASDPRGPANESILRASVDDPRAGVRKIASTLLLDRLVARGEAPLELLENLHRSNERPSLVAIEACRCALDLGHPLEPRIEPVLVAAIDGGGLIRDTALAVLRQHELRSDALAEAVRRAVASIRDDGNWPNPRAVEALAVIDGDENAAAALLGEVDPDLDPSLMGLMDAASVALDAPKVAESLRPLLEADPSRHGLTRRHRAALAMLHLGGDPTLATRVLLETARTSALEGGGAAIQMWLLEGAPARMDLDLVLTDLASLPIDAEDPDRARRARALAERLHLPILWRAGDRASDQLPALRSLHRRQRGRALDVPIERLVAWIESRPSRPNPEVHIGAW